MRNGEKGEGLGELENIPKRRAPRRTLNRRKHNAAPSDPMAEGALNPARDTLRPHNHTNPNVPAGDAWMPRFELESVARHAARVLVGCVFDYDQAARVIAPARYVQFLSDIQIGRLRDRLESDPRVRTEVEKILTADGLDEHSKMTFVREMWAWLRSGNRELMVRAAAILGKGFIGEKVLVDRPEDLPIQNFEEGLRMMMGPVEVRALPSRVGEDEEEEEVPAITIPAPPAATPAPPPPSIFNIPMEKLAKVVKIETLPVDLNPNTQKSENVVDGEFVEVGVGTGTPEVARDFDESEFDCERSGGE